MSRFNKNIEEDEPLLGSSSTHLNMDSGKIVEICIEYLQVGNVDTMNEHFRAQARIISQWEENEMIENYDPKVNWNPKLYIENAWEGIKEDIEYSTKKIDANKTIVTETRISTGKFWERMELNDFPLDIQELSIVLASKLNASAIKLVQSNSRPSTISYGTLDRFKDQQKFTLYKYVTTSDCPSYEIGSPSETENQAKFVSTAYCSRKPRYYLINYYSFNFLITFLVLTQFISTDVKKASSRLAGSFTLLLTTFSFKIVTSSGLPTISYFTSLDKYQIANILYICACCLWHAVCSSLDLDYDLKVHVDKIIFYSAAALLLIIQAVLVIGLIISNKKLKSLREEEEKFKIKENLSGCTTYYDD